MKSYINNNLKPEGRKMFLYSSHELNVALTLIGFKVFYPHVPGYASFILIEFHEIDGVYGIQVINTFHKFLILICLDHFYTFMIDEIIF